MLQQKAATLDPAETATQIAAPPGGFARRWRMAAWAPLLVLVLLCAIIDHSLTIVLVVTGFAWAVVYARMDPGGKAGQVVGNIVSEWTQILGLVVITKYTREMGSKEGN